MTDQQPAESSHEIPGNTSDGISTKQISMKDTPPVAVPDTAPTPADSGSDFYNTPWPVGTPSNNNEKMDNVVPGNEGDSTMSPKPAALIPGLSLVNDKLSEQQPADNEPIPSLKTDNENTNMDLDPETADREKHEVAPTTGDAMDVEGAGEAAKANIDGHANNASTKETASAPQETVGTEQKSHETIPAAGDAMETEQSSVQHSREEAMKADTNGPANNANATETPAPAETAGAEEEDEHPEWEIDSSPYESSSDDSTTDSSDDSDDDDEDYPILSPEEQARILMQAELGSDDEGEGKGKAGGHIKTANEMPEEILPIPEVTVTPDMKITMLGNVSAIVENAVLIEANISGEYQVLESGSLLCLEDRSVVGVVSETLGRVEQPLYALRYATAAEVEDHGLSKGKPIYYVDNHSTFVFTQPLKGMKGSDASNFHDEEVGEDEIEFSDDEAEAEYKRKMKQKRQERKEAKNEHGGPSRTRKGPPGPSKLSQSELNYDDNGAEDGYTPLARPKNLHEIMGHQEAPVEGSECAGRGSFRGGRGRGRGFDRGRGNRGRGGGRGGSWQSHDDRRPQHQQYHQSSAVDSLPQPPSYGQPVYPQNQQPVYGTPQQFPSYPSYPPQPYAQSPIPTQFPFQMPYQQPYQQPNLYQQIPPGAHVNPVFLAALQQQQQQQYQQQPQQTQNTALNFDQVKAQLDILRQLSNGNQGPRPT